VGKIIEKKSSIKGVVAPLVIEIPDGENNLKAKDLANMLKVSKG